MYCIEDIVHILTQCPYYQEDRDLMYKEIFDVCPNVRDVLEKESAHVAYYLLGKKICSINDKEMLCFWCISGNAISRMYRKALASRTGIG